jgi:heme oxygenase (biliverdin-IX-beta and delta-forming)
MLSRDIKARTEAVHRQVEQNRIMSALMNADLSREQYAAALRKLYGYFQPLMELVQFRLDQALIPHGSPAEGFRRILDDLSFVERDAVCVPLCQELPEIDTSAKAIGALYVAEGSSLGGRVIARKIKDSLELDASAGASYFHGAGDGTAARWLSFVSLLDAYGEEPEVAEEVMQSAEDTFCLFNAWLENKTLYEHGF